MNQAQSGAAFSSVKGTAPATNIVEIPGAPTRLLIAENMGVWSDAVIANLTELVRLPIGWDGYMGVPVGLANAYFALQMLEKVCGLKTEAPQIVPGDAGDLQVEWHTLRGDIELHVRAPNNVHAWVARADGDPNGEEFELTNDFATVAHWVKDIVEPTD